jgi:hypothetical protein
MGKNMTQLLKVIRLGFGEKFDAILGAIRAFGTVDLACST